MVKAGFKKRAYRASRNYRQNLVGMLTITVIVCVLLCVICVKSSAMHRTIEQNNETISQLETQIEDETKRTDSIEKKGEYMQSDEYVAKIAREKLGLVNDGEIMFKETK